jgi:hypothetical protein
MANTPVDQLDFDLIKKSLRDYLRGQETFKDYDFEGSTLNIILDLLAYNTHYQAFYANMVANEAFLDSARKRASVVSLAKHLNYTPRSTKSARINVDIEYLVNNTEDIRTANLRSKSGSLTIPRGTKFTTRGQNGDTVTFNTLSDHRVEVFGNQFVARNVTIYEGAFKSESYIVNTRDTNQRFLITDKNVDVDTILLRVAKSVSNTANIDEVWQKATDITELSGDSTVFFLQEAEDQTWEIYFGDGIIGRALENGNLITIVYLSSKGTLGNGVGSTDSENTPTFSVVDEVYKATVVVNDEGKPQPSYGGESPEEVESVKYYAPRSYQAQDRAVTKDDYLALLARDYSLRSESFLVWGGEENDPPQYGKVFISIKPKNSPKLSITEKQSIARTVLRDRSILTVTPEVVDPDITYIVPKVKVYFDSSKTFVTSTEMSTSLRNRTIEFGDENLNKFGSNFRASKFLATIDRMDTSINSSNVDLVLEKVIEPVLGQSFPYTINFDNPLKHPIDGYPSILESTAFYYIDYASTSANKPSVVAYFDDDGYGKVRIYKLVNGNKVYLVDNVGTINYETGKISLKNFAPISILDGSSEIRISVIPNRNDIFVRRNQVLEFNDDKIQVDVYEEKTVIDRGASDRGFPFNT